MIAEILYSRNMFYYVEGILYGRRFSCWPVQLFVLIQMAVAHSAFIIIFFNVGAGDLNSYPLNHLPIPTAKIWKSEFLDTEFSNSWHSIFTVLFPHFASEQVALAMLSYWSSHSSHWKSWGSNSACSMSYRIKLSCTSSSWEILTVGPRIPSSIFPGRSVSPWMSSSVRLHKRQQG